MAKHCSNRTECRERQLLEEMSLSSAGTAPWGLLCNTDGSIGLWNIEFNAVISHKALHKILHLKTISEYEWLFFLCVCVKLVFADSKAKNTFFQKCSWCLYPSWSAGKRCVMHSLFLCITFIESNNYSKVSSVFHFHYIPPIRWP